MDTGQFETLVSRLSTHLTRRRSLRIASALGIAGASLAPAAEARKKKKKGNKKTATCTPAPLTCPGGQKVCNGVCIVAERCCADGDCAPGRACVNGVCDCATNTTPCRELCCITSSQVCVTSTDSSGRVTAKCLDRF
jgi:hypothetical protein